MRPVFLLAICFSFCLSIVVSAQPATRLTADKLFQPDHVVDIQIELPEESWDEIRVQSRNFVKSLSREPVESPFTYVKADVTIDGVLIKEVGLRKKGFLGSLANDRPSLKIKFSEYRDQKPIAGLDRLTLNNNKQDPARYCQYLAYRLFRDSGTACPRCNFARVTVNGNYLGIYSNVESMRKPMLQHAFGDDSGALWEGTVVDFFPGWLGRFEAKNKKAKPGRLEDVADLLAEETVDIQALGELLDIDAFVRFWAMESLIGFWDGYCSNQNNYFIYQNPINNKLYFIPWGTDSAFAKTTPLPPYRIRPMSVHSKSILCNKLYRIPEIQKQYEQTLMAFLDEHWDEEALLAEIDQIESLLADHVWEDNRGFESRSKSYRDFITWRRKVLMREFRKGPPELKSRERTPIYFEQMGTAQIAFETVWYDRTPRKTAGLGELTVKLDLDGEEVEYEEVGVYSERSKWPTEDKIPPASIVVTGKRKSDGKTVTLGLAVPDSLFQPTGEETVEIGGILMVNNAFVDSQGRMQMIAGQVQLDAASTESGQPVKGTMEIAITRMKGGEEFEPDADKKPDNRP